jgi:hypothetical protein
MGICITIITNALNAKSIMQSIRRINPMATMRSFIKDNRQELDQSIRTFLNDPEYKLNDEERRKWILNDESLYNWARSEGVKI